MLIAPVVSPADSSASWIVSALRERCFAFRSTIVSRSERANPAARIAPKDEPYSTMRCSARYHHTRCGISCTSGYAPVEIDARQTGVSDGKTDQARRYSPCSARKRIAGVSAASNTDGVSPSMTMITTGLIGLILGKGAQARVRVGRAAAEARAQHGHRERLEVAEHRHEGGRGAADRDEPQQQRRPAARAAAPQRAGDERRRAERAAGGADETGDGLVPVEEREADRDGDRSGDHEREDRLPQNADGRHAECGAE